MPLASIAKQLPAAEDVAELYVYPAEQGADFPSYEVHFRDAEGQLYSLILSAHAMMQIRDASRASLERLGAC